MPTPEELVTHNARAHEVARQITANPEGLDLRSLSTRLAITAHVLSEESSRLYLLAVEDAQMDLLT